MRLWKSARLSLASGGERRPHRNAMVGTPSRKRPRSRSGAKTSDAIETANAFPGGVFQNEFLAGAGR